MEQAHRPFKSQDFGRWRWVVCRVCPNGHHTRIRANNTRAFGKPTRPDLPPGAVKCSTCNELVRLG